MSRNRASSTPRGQIALVVGGLLALGCAGLIALFAMRGTRDGIGTDQEWFAARRGSFDVAIPCSGELVAVRQIEIRNQLDSEGLITEITPEGKNVAAGDVLVKFNDEELRAKLTEAIDAEHLADAALIAAESELNVRTKERESELAKDRVAIELADLAMKAWEDGEDDSKRQRLELARDSARKNQERMAEHYETSRKLCDQKFISLDELKKDEIDMLDAKSKLDQAQIDLDLYVKYQSKQEHAKKASDLEQARGELERAAERLDAKVRSAQSELESKRLQLQSRRDRKRLLEQQIGYCTVTAPTPGLVVYSSSMETGRWYGNDGPPHVGAKIYPNQPVIFLPDTSQMAADVKVSEALSNSIKVGQKASVLADALSNLTLSGEVTSIGVLAESGGWRDPNRRDYTVRIALDAAPDAGLKPCMRCKADIHVERIADALHVPVQAVQWAKPVSFVYVPDGRGVSQRAVKLGRSSELFTEILDGLIEGDRVLLREPQAQEIVSRLPSLKAGDATTPPSVTTMPELAQPSIEVAQPVAAALTD